jgi:hypothetical protein
MNFEYDILISYAQADGLENPDTAAWSHQFCDYFKILLSRLTDKPPNIILHDELRNKQILQGENIRDILAKTAVFITILSPDYAKSPAYIRDLEEICSSAHAGNTEEENLHRIFKVITSPVQTIEAFDFLNQEISYNFYEINRYNKKPVPFDLRSKSGPQEKYWPKLVDLAYDVVDKLKVLATSDIRSLLPKKTTPAVFLAETSFDQVDNRDMLRRELQHMGFRVLPLSPLPEEAEKSKQAIDHILEQTIMSVHLLGAWYGDFIKNSKYSFIDFQIKTVKDYIGNKSIQQKPHQIIWIPNDIKPTDQRQALYLKRLKRDEAQYMTEIIETPFEVFKTILGTRLNDLTRPTEVTVSEKNKLYVIYESISAPMMTGYTNLLRKNGFDVIEPFENGGDFFPLSKHIQNLVLADAVIVYKGNSTMEWLNSKIRDLVKAPGFGKSKPFRGIEIISKQKTADKSMLFLKNVPVIWDEEINDEVVNHFIEHLAKK